MEMSLLEITKQLVSYQTVSVSQDTTGIANMIDFITDYLNDVCTVRPYGTGVKKNIVATFGQTDIAPALAFSGHMDTVTVPQINRNPLSLSLSGNKYYGLGIADMKLFIAYCLLISRNMHQNITKPFAMYFTCDEEIGCIGAKKLVKDKDFICAKNVVIGEPTEFVPIYRHKGYIHFNIEIKLANGNEFGGHSSDPRRSTNIITVGLPPVIENIKELTNHLENVYSPLDSPPYPSLNIGVLKLPDGILKSKIPGKINIEGEIRPVYGQDIQAIITTLESALSQTQNNINNSIREKNNHIVIKLSLLKAPSFPMVTAVNSPLIKSCEKIWKNQTQSVPFNTEGGWYNLVGKADTVILGPGSINQAHKVDEYVDIKYLDEKNIFPYIELIKLFCA